MPELESIASPLGAECDPEDRLSDVLEVLRLQDPVPLIVVRGEDVLGTIGLEANGSAGSCIGPMNCGVMIAPIGPEYTHGKLCPPILRYTGQIFRHAPQRMQ